MLATYFNRVDLLLTILPETMKDPRIAIKGGTAINLFTLNLPRLSVDIDLTYLPIEDRQTSLSSIDQILAEIRERIERRGFSVQPKLTSDGHAKQLIVEDQRDLVKIEINHVLRGCVYPSKQMNLCTNATSTFKKFVTVQCMSFEDLYGGKFCAALDRQHPRDLYDVKLFFENFEITDDLKKAFIVYLISHNRPINEMIQPHLLDRSDLFDDEFLGMVQEDITYEELETARSQLIDRINRVFTSRDKTFLLSFKEGKPQWDLLDVKDAEHFPAVRWKLMNIQKMEPAKHREMLKALGAKLGM